MLDDHGAIDTIDAPGRNGAKNVETFDLIVRGGLVIDGTGLPRRRVDVGVRDGRIARLGLLDDATAPQVIDAHSAIVAPGIVDVHTHYDPQVTYDPYATMSCYHGVTTVVAGNCGFSVAPCRPGDVAALKDIFASVEDMDPGALDNVKWAECETFPGYLESLKGKLGVNFACYVGHSNLRRWVMGDDCLTRTATADEIAAMVALLSEAMEAGAAGLSSSHAPTHLDIHGRPVPSRLSDEAELGALVEEVGRHKAASITYLPKSAIGGMVQDDLDLLLRLSKKAGVPVIIQGIGGKTKVDVPTAGWDWASKYLTDATEQGAPVYSLLVTRPLNRAFPLGPENKHHRSVFSWQAMWNLPIEERRALLSDPAAREEMRFAVENYNRDPELGTTLRPPAWELVFVDEVVLEKNRPLQGLSIQAIADQQGKAPGDVVLDLALEEDFATSLVWQTETPEWCAIVREALMHPSMIAGTSDGGAHLAKDDGADWSSHFLKRWVIEEKLWTLEEGVRQITQRPAALMGLHDRGVLRVGGWADIMVFEPENIGLLRKEFTRDLPGGAGRWRSWAKGVRATIVNGQPIVLDGELTDALPGHVVAPC